MREIGEQACKDTADDEDCMFTPFKDVGLTNADADYPDGYPEYLKVDGCTTAEAKREPGGDGSTTMECADGRVSIYNAADDGAPVQTAAITIGANE